MLTSLQLENYRGFERYRLEVLARVNLLVVRNNCGKTSVLEAVHLLASGGNPNVLARTAWDRGEVLLSTEESDQRRSAVYPVLSHFFHGHQFHSGAFFTVCTDDGFGSITVRVVSSNDLDPQHRLFKEMA